MPILRPHTVVHPVLRSTAQETGRLCALIGGYAALIALFVLTALSVWRDLPGAVADSRLFPDITQQSSNPPVKLRGSL